MMSLFAFNASVYVHKSLRCTNSRYYTYINHTVLARFISTFDAANCFETNSWILLRRFEVAFGGY